jgi:hypothetical protein
VQQNPIDAIPDLSENQVIVFTEWMGEARSDKGSGDYPFGFLIYKGFQN